MTTLPTLRNCAGQWHLERWGFSEFLAPKEGLLDFKEFARVTLCEALPIHLAYGAAGNNGVEQLVSCTDRMESVMS